jgi:predicted nucleic acid-binding protein
VTQKARYLADSSIWIEHLSGRLHRFEDLLQEEAILCHPAVIGEVALGSLRNRTDILGSMAILPDAEVASDAEVLRLVNNTPLYARGIGWIDCHLVASSMLSNAKLLTRDRRLAAVAADLGIAADL